jgi:SAM-dependent methyltransferase
MSDANESQTASPLADPFAWDLVADGYAEEVVPMFERFAERALELGAVQAGSRVLDVATGPGTLALLAARHGAEVTAVDFSSAMIERLRSRAAGQGLENVRAVVGDGQALELPDRVFDAAFSMFGVIFFPDRARGFGEMARVLAPRGRAVISSWPPVEGVPLLASIFASVRAHVPGLPFGAGRTPLGEPDDIRREMSAAGFVDVHVEEFTGGHDFPSMAEAWRSLARSTAPLALLRRKLGDVAWQPVAERIHADLVSRFGSGPVHLEALAYIGIGRRGP